ncbi:MAG: polyprenyl synthetase family protein [Chitinophagaceae bacterium]
MYNYKELVQQFNEYLKKNRLPNSSIFYPLYHPAQETLFLDAKRIRPVLALMAYELIKPLEEEIWQVGLAIEIFHNFTLVHDDIMDDAPLRRGSPTVFAKHGNNQSILIGDVMLILAYRSLEALTPEKLYTVYPIFNKTAQEVCEGQFLDMAFENRHDITLDEYIEMIRLKTSVSLGASLEIGVALAGTNMENRKKLYGIGLNMGIIFQIYDDYLDVFGKQEKTGKQIGGDILANKKTFLLLKSLELADNSIKVKIQSLLQKPPSHEKIQEMIKIFKELEVDKAILKLHKEYTENIFNLLNTLDIEETRKKPLQELTGYLFTREK